MTIPIRYSKPEKVQTKAKEAKLTNMDVSYLFFETVVYSIPILKAFTSYFHGITLIIVKSLVMNKIS